MKKGSGTFFRPATGGRRGLAKMYLTPFSLLASMTLALAACGGGTGVVVKPQVLTPPPSSPRSDFFVEKTEVQSREVGSEAWQRNEEYGRVLTETLRAALRDRGKNVTSPPADVVRAKVYLAYGAAPVTTKDSRRSKAHVEVRLQLLDAATGAAIYTTHTLTPITRPTFGWNSPDTDQVIREVLDKAALDFVSRL